MPSKKAPPKGPGANYRVLSAALEAMRWRVRDCEHSQESLRTEVEELRTKVEELIDTLEEYWISRDTRGKS